MPEPILRRSFLALHLALGLGLLYLSLRSAIHALSGPTGDPHVVALGSIETLGALLFLLPPALRVGGVLLLLTLGFAALEHILLGQFRTDLLIYSAAVWFVMVHGPAWRVRPPAPTLAT
jgi:hypothetical protein